MFAVATALKQGSTKNIIFIILQGRKETGTV